LFSQQVAPYEVLRIEKHEDLTITSTPYETNVEELTQEMIEHESLSSDQKEKVRSTFSNFLSYMFPALHASKCFVFILVHTSISGKNYIIGIWNI